MRQLFRLFFEFLGIEKTLDQYKRLRGAFFGKNTLNHLDDNTHVEVNGAVLIFLMLIFQIFIIAGLSH
jgi:hypothetical protein